MNSGLFGMPGLPAAAVGNIVARPVFSGDGVLTHYPRVGTARESLWQSLAIAAESTGGLQAYPLQAAMAYSGTYSIGTQSEVTGGAVTKVLVSTNGYGWTQRTLPIAAYAPTTGGGIVWGISNFLFCPAASNNVIYRSPDGVTWTAGSAMSTSTAGRRLVKFKGKIYAFYGGTTYHECADDGIAAWTARTAPATLLPLNSYGNVFSNSSRMWVYGSAGAWNYTADGTNWSTSTPQPFVASAGSRTFMCGNESWLALFTTSTPYTSASVIYSTDQGATWQTGNDVAFDFQFSYRGHTNTAGGMTGYGSHGAQIQIQGEAVTIGSRVVVPVRISTSNISTDTNQSHYYTVMHSINGKDWLVEQPMAAAAGAPNCMTVGVFASGLVLGLNINNGTDNRSSLAISNPSFKEFVYAG